MTEPVRAHLAIVQGVLAPLDEVTRTAVLVELAIVEAKELEAVRKQLDDARENAAEWRRHNEQRMEEVYAVREMLKATPDETLMVAVKRTFDAWSDDSHRWTP